MKKKEWFVSVTANITDCRSVATGSTPVRTANVDSSLSGKVSRCEREEQGSSPGANQQWFIV